MRLKRAFDKKNELESEKHQEAKQESERKSVEIETKKESKEKNLRRVTKGESSRQKERRVSLIEKEGKVKENFYTNLSMADSYLSLPSSTLYVSQENEVVCARDELKDGMQNIVPMEIET